MSNTLKSHKSTKLNIIVSAVVVLSILAWFLSGILFSSNESDETIESVEQSDSNGSANSPNDTEEIQSVYIEEISPKEIERKIELTGFTQAHREVSIKSKTTSTVSAILPVKGKYLRKGAVLARLDIEHRKEDLDRANALLSQLELENNAATELFKENLISELEKQRVAVSYFQARSDHKISLDNYNNTQIRIPFSGYIDSIEIDEGDYIVTGQDIATVYDLNPYEVVTRVSEREFSFLKEGQKALITLANLQEFIGEISYIHKIADANRLYEIEISIDNSKQEILPINMTAYINIFAGSSSAFNIPASLLLTDESGQLGIKTVNEENIVEFLPVRIWDSDNINVAISPINNSEENASIKVITLGGTAEINSVVNPIILDSIEN